MLPLHPLLATNFLGLVEKLALTLWSACRIFPTHDEGMSAHERGKSSWTFENKFGLRLVGDLRRLNDSIHRPGDQRTTWMG